MINNYRDMWARHSELIAPLSRFTSKNVKFQWTEIEQQAFEKIKNVVCREVLLSYPDFSQPFHIHTNARHLQLGAVAHQSKPSSYSIYSCKLQPAQT
jgi:hypothetical protein